MTTAESDLLSGSLEDAQSKDQIEPEDPLASEEDERIQQEDDQTTFDDVETEYPPNADNLTGESDLSTSAEKSGTSASTSVIGAGWYKVVQGDCITNIAFRAGFAQKTIWNHPENSKLKSKRKDQNALMPGDMVYIPEKQPLQKLLPTEKRHRFVRNDVPAKLIIKLMALGEPRRNVQYILNVDGHLIINGTTDDDGYLKCNIPPNSVVGKLIIEPGPFQDEYELTLGGIDPIDEISGIQGRLANLGYDCETNGELDDRTRSALAAFQEDHGLKATGEIDTATKEKLEAIHEG